ncbi:MAG: sensor histidine kinase, partial [Parabacteroides distasonis]|nr:sensor histidine kinase [Parabacteroides distasonis]
MMKHLLYIFLVLAALFAAIYLLPERSPLFEYYRLRPIFEISSILLLIVVLYLYRREKRQVKMIFSRLSQKNFFLDLAIQCGGIYIWEFKDEEFFFKYPVGDQPSRIELEEMWKLIHPDDLIAFKLQRQSLWKADKEVFQCRARFTGSDYEWWEFRFSAMPAVDNAEGGKDVSGILININDMKKREKELILMRGYEQKFLANMSHEIRTPLNSIVGFSNLLA